MAIRTAIEYADSSINPIRGCGGCELWTAENKVCYAGHFISRFASQPGWPDAFTHPIMVPGVIQKTWGWSNLKDSDRPDKPWLNGLPRIIFLNDMSDTFTERIWQHNYITGLGTDWLKSYMLPMIASGHIYLILTKRPRRAVKFFRHQWGRVPANFWVGTSLTYPHTVSRVVELLRLRNYCDGKLWLSIEPLYGTLDLLKYLPAIDWVTFGGESGQGGLKTELSDFLKIMNDCHKTDTTFFMKQLGTAHGHGTKGQDWLHWPEEIKVRQMPM